MAMQCYLIQRGLIFCMVEEFKIHQDMCRSYHVQHIQNTHSSGIVLLNIFEICLLQVELVERFLEEEISKRVPGFSMDEFTQTLM